VSVRARRTTLRAALLAALLCAAVPATARAVSEPPPVPPPMAPAAPAPGALKLTLQHVGGTPPFVLAGATITVRGVVAPYVAGQSVKVSIYRQGRKIAVRRLPVAPTVHGKGLFTVRYASRFTGEVDVRVAHYATAAQTAFAGRAPLVHVVSPNLGFGSGGQSVRLLQSELDVLHYAVPLSGTFDEGTGRALIAYRKMVGLDRVAAAGPAVFAMLSRHAGAFQVHYPGDGRHVEGDLTRQVLAEIEPGGRVHAIYTMSSGKPSTPTVIGRFRVYLKTPGVNSEGMVDSNYFIRGYAIHGYPEVPTYAASHGCLRVPIPDAPAIFAWVQDGTPVDVYNEGGGGSSRVRSNAGP
jgi:peptidoglycan hydrolase-like protein with peptidoglycan-binding domain